ncbi:hypothetical protein PtB15_11B107 [Puccinia triticina]|nr:hypothetical protein PtB15_11B107 [Puccinia triticina]
MYIPNKNSFLASTPITSLPGSQPGVTNRKSPFHNQRRTHCVLSSEGPGTKQPVVQTLRIQLRQVSQPDIHPGSNESLAWRTDIKSIPKRPEHIGLAMPKEHVPIGPMPLAVSRPADIHNGHRPPPSNASSSIQRAPSARHTICHFHANSSLRSN